MINRRIWILAFGAMCLAGLLMYASFCVSDTVYEASSQLRLDAWKIDNGNVVLYEAAPFRTVGSLKDAQQLSLTAFLPATNNKSFSFVAIGYVVEAFVDGESVYAFGSAAEGWDVWGVKTHLFSLPDGVAGREFKLTLRTNQPAYIAISPYAVLADAAEIIRLLVKSNAVKIAFAALYMASSLVLLMVLAVLALYRKFSLGLSMVAMIMFLMGLGIFLNISIVAYFTGPEAVHWIISIINLALPIPTLLFIAADKEWEKSRWLLAMATVQSIFLLIYVVCNLLHIDFFLLSWYQVLFVAAAVTMLSALWSEFRSGQGRPLVAAAMSAILLSSVIDACSYFTTGNHDTMDLSLIILTLPVLVVMSGDALQRAAQKEYDIINENLALRLRDAMLYKNYLQIEKYIEQTKRIWHDIDKHMSTIQTLINQRQYDEVRKYIKQAGFSFRETKKLYLCANKLVNAVLADKLTEAESKGIAMTLTGDVPDTLAIQSNDLCSLLVNILDNAIEACGKIPPGRKKTIDLRLKTKQGFVYFECQNTVAASPDQEQELPPEEPTGRGYGLSIIRSIVEKYHGVFDITATVETFFIQGTIKNVAGGAYPHPAHAMNLTGGLTSKIAEKQEACSSLPTWQEFQQALITKVTQDKDFRKALLAAPKAVLQQEMAKIGVCEELPEELEVKVLEQHSGILYIVVSGDDNMELSDASLDQVAAGTSIGPQAGISRWWQQRQGEI